MEDEQHFIFHCNYYNPNIFDFLAHMTKSVAHLLDLSDNEKPNSFMFEENAHTFCKCMCNIYEIRQEKKFV